VSDSDSAGGALTAWQVGTAGPADPLFKSVQTFLFKQVHKKREIQILNGIWQSFHEFVPAFIGQLLKVCFQISGETTGATGTMIFLNEWGLSKTFEYPKIQMVKKC